MPGLNQQTPSQIVDNARHALKSVRNLILGVAKTPIDKALLSLEFDPKQLSRTFPGKFDYLDRGKVSFYLLALLVFEIVAFNSFLAFLLFNVVIGSFAIYRRQWMLDLIKAHLERDVSRQLIREASKVLLLKHEVDHSDIKLRIFNFIRQERDYDGALLLQLFMDLHDAVQHNEIDQEQKLNQFSRLFNDKDLACLTAVTVASKTISESKEFIGNTTSARPESVPPKEEKSIPSTDASVECEKTVKTEPEQSTHNKLVAEIIRVETDSNPLLDSESSSAEHTDIPQQQSSDENEKQKKHDEIKEEKDSTSANSNDESKSRAKEQDVEDNLSQNSANRPKDVFDEDDEAINESEETNSLDKEMPETEDDSPDFSSDMEDMGLPDFGSDAGLPDLSDLNTEGSTDFDTEYDIQEEDYL